VQQNRVFGALTFAFVWVGGVWFLLLRELKKKKRKRVVVVVVVVVEEFCKCKEVAMAGGKRKSEDDGQSLNTRVAPVPMKQFGEDSAFPSLPPLDHKRAVQCLQNVRALNTQFSSWVQNQEREHLDELWQGGMEDYLKHATTIMAEFRDVVDWVKAKTSSSMPGILTSTNTASSLPAVTTAKPSGNVTSILQNVSNTSGAGGFWNQTSSFPPMTSSSGFNGMSSGLGFGSAHFKPTSAPLPMFPSFGVVSSAPIFSSPTPQPSLSISLPQSTPFSTVVHGTVEEADDREEIEEPSSPSLKRTEEAGIKVIHDVKSKLYIKVGYLIMHGIEFITIPFGNHVFCKGLKFWD
jgi:hypothetical protein